MLGQSPEVQRNKLFQNSFPNYCTCTYHLYFVLCFVESGKEIKYIKNPCMHTDLFMTKLINVEHIF